MIVGGSAHSLPHDVKVIDLKNENAECFKPKTVLWEVPGQQLEPSFMDQHLSVAMVSSHIASFTTNRKVPTAKD